MCPKRDPDTLLAKTTCNNDISHIITRLGWLANWVLLTADLNSNNVVWSLLGKWKDLCSPLRNESIFRNTDVWVWNQAWNVSLFSGQYSWPPSRCKVGPEGKWFPHAMGLRWFIVCLFIALRWPCWLVNRFYLKMCLREICVGKADVCLWKLCQCQKTQEVNRAFLLLSMIWYSECLIYHEILNAWYQ